MAHIPREPDAGSDVTGTLAELERKLRELEQELSILGRGRAPDPAQRATADSLPRTPTDVTQAFPPPAAEPTHAFSGRLIDEATESRASALPPSERRAESPSSYVPMSAVPPASASAQSGGPSDAQLAGLAELRRFGTQLEQATRQLTVDYEQVLERVRQQLSSSPPSAPTPDEIMFEGRVELGVGPFYDIGSLSHFEQRVAGLEHASDVVVRRFEASHAVLELRLTQPIALVGELRSALDMDFSVREIAGGRLVLSFDDV
jgi:hypothetical protein